MGAGVGEGVCCPGVGAGVGEGVFHNPVPHPDSPMGVLLKLPRPEGEGDDCADADCPKSRTATTSTRPHLRAASCIVLSSL